MKTRSKAVIEVQSCKQMEMMPPVVDSMPTIVTRWLKSVISAAELKVMVEK